MVDRLRPLTTVFSVAALVLLLAGLYLGLLGSEAPAYRVGQELRACPVCRIFYLHVALAWVAFLAFFVVFVASILFLRTNRGAYDRLARSSAEIGVVFTSLVLVTGSIWARPIWGTWWTWDARLTTTLILWFIYVGYLMLRAYAGSERRGARFAAVLGIVGFVDVPIVYFSVVLWRTIHPPYVFVDEAGMALPPGMLAPLLLTLLGTMALYLALLLLRYRVERLKEEAQALRLRLAGQEV
jgi:heme exporter protein C